MTTSNERDFEDTELTEKLNGPGYVEIGTNVFVPEEDAFDFAIDRCVDIVPDGFRGVKWTEEFRKMLVDWFYSGNWIKIGGLGEYGRI